MGGYSLGYSNRIAELKRERDALRAAVVEMQKVTGEHAKFVELADYDAVCAERDALRAALEAVEFVGPEPYCPWCHERWPHAPDCQRQAALCAGSPQIADKEQGDE